MKMGFLGFGEKEEYEEKKEEPEKKELLYLKVWTSDHDHVINEFETEREREEFITELKTIKSHPDFMFVGTDVWINKEHVVAYRKYDEEPEEEDEEE